MEEASVCSRPPFPPLNVLHAIWPAFGYPPTSTHAVMVLVIKGIELSTDYPWQGNMNIICSLLNGLDQPFPASNRFSMRLLKAINLMAAISKKHRQREHKPSIGERLK